MEPDILEHIVEGREKPTNLPFALLKNITEHFSEDRVIGKGGFATVYKGVLPNVSVAVKRISNRHSIDQKLFYREVDSLLTISHQNIVRFLGFCASTDQTAIKVEGSREHIYAEIRERLLCFEYVSNGSLQEHISDELRGLDWNTRYQIIRGVCEGLHHLHKERHIYHMDLKPANILLDNHMVPKITDFGLARLDEKSQTMSEDRWGSLGYCAPEYLRSGRMSFKSDMFSLGIIITELVTGGKGIPDNNKNNVLRRWRHRWRKSGKETPLVYQQVAKCMEIGLLCQEIDPSKRPFIWDMIHDIREMEGVNGRVSNAYEHTFGQISPYSEDDMLGVEPLKLHFPFELNKQISCSLKLTNQTDSYIAFNIQKMSPLQYCMEPNKDIVPPQSKCSVVITLQPQDKAPRDIQRADEFTVWSTKVNEGLATEDITIDMFSKENGVVDAMNLDVCFDTEESTKVNDDLASADITRNIFSKETCVIGEVNSDVVSYEEELLDTQTLVPNKLDISLYDELLKKLQDSNATPMFLPLHFLILITCNFSAKLELGRGEHGVVYKGNLGSGKFLAVKNLFRILKEETFHNEVSCLIGIKHQNLVQFLGYCTESRWEREPIGSEKPILAEKLESLLCFEYVSNRSLDKHISDESFGLEWNMRYEIIKGICSGLHFLHEKCNIVHLGLKPENILMDSTMTPKIMDFGLSRIFGEQQSQSAIDNRAQTGGYVAPEYLNQGVISKKADIFSLGVIIIEIITGRREYPYIQLDSPHNTATSCQHFIEKVIRSWRNRFASALKYISMEKYNQQVKLCISIALTCVDLAIEKRPTTKDIVQVFGAADQMEALEELPSEMQCMDKSLVLKSTVSKEIIPHSITEDMVSNETNGKLGDVRKWLEGLSLTPPLWESSSSSQNHQEAAKESSEPPQMEAHEELSSDMPYTDNLLQDMLNNNVDGKVVGKTTSEGFSPMLSLESSTNNQNYQEAVKESNEPQLAIDATTEVTASSSELLDVHPLELNFPVEPNKVITCSLHLTNNNDKQVVFRLREKRYNWMCFLKLPLYGIVPPRSTCTLDVTTGKKENLPKERSVDLILQTSISDLFIMPFQRGYDCDQYFENSRKLENTVHNVALKAIYAPQGETTNEVEVHEDFPLYMQCTDKLAVNTMRKDFTPHSVTEDMLINTVDDKLVNEAKSDKGLSPTLLWDSSEGNQYYLGVAKDSSEPQSAHDTTTETEVIPGPSALLDIYPLELHFCFEPNKLIPCSLDLTNNTDENLVFVLMEKSNNQSCFLCLPLYGIVAPWSTYTLVVTTNKNENLPEERNVDLILQNSTIGYYPICNDAEHICTEHFKEAEKLGKMVSKVALKTVCAPQGEATFEQAIPPLIKIISVEDTDSIHCIDANPTEPLIVTGSFRYVHMQNYALQKSVGSVEASRSETVSCVKFISRKRWLVAGSSDGSVHVYTYEKKMEKITSFEAHNLDVCSLAVHPTQPYVLSGSRAQIKLWKWEQPWSWKCIQTFKEHWGYVCGLAFNPEDTNSFASFTNGSKDHTIQVWSLDSPECKYSLSGHSHNVRCLDFFTRDGQQYLITGSLDKTAKIWGMEKNECVCSQPHESAILSVASHPNLPVLVTGTEDGHIHLWSSNNFRLKRILNIHGREWVEGLACLVESQRVVVAHKHALSVIEIRDEDDKQGYGSKGSSEDSIPAADCKIQSQPRRTIGTMAMPNAGRPYRRPRREKIE